MCAYPKESKALRAGHRVPRGLQLQLENKATSCTKPSLLRQLLLNPMPWPEVWVAHARQEAVAGGSRRQCLQHALPGRCNCIKRIPDALRTKHVVSANHLILAFWPGARKEGKGEGGAVLLDKRVVCSACGYACQ